MMAAERAEVADEAGWRGLGMNELDSFPVFPRRRSASAPAAAAAPVEAPLRATEAPEAPGRMRSVGRLSMILAVPVISLAAIAIWAAGAEELLPPLATAAPVALSSAPTAADGLAREVARLREVRDRELLALDGLRRQTAAVRAEIDRLLRERDAATARPAPLPERLVSASDGPAPTLRIELPDPVAAAAQAPEVAEPAAAAVTASVEPPARTPWRIVIHHARDELSSQARAEALASSLARRGAGAATVRAVGFSIERMSVRYFFQEDAVGAADLHWLTQELDPGPTDQDIDQPQDFSHFRPLPRKGTIEIWLAS